MSRIGNWARLSFRIQRLEILLLTAVVLVGAGVMGWSAYQLANLSASYPDCNFLEPAAPCAVAGETFGSIFELGELVVGSSWLLSVGVGLFLGVPLVAREVEQGTAQLAWTVGRSRLQWLIGRVAFATTVALVLLAILAVMTDVLAAAMRPEINTAQAFWFYGGRGPFLIGAGLLSLGAGVLVGATVGKQLPALLLAFLTVGALSLAGDVGFRAWHEAEAVLASDDDRRGEPLGISSGVELMNGALVPHSAAGAEFQDENDVYYANEADFKARRNPIGTPYQLIIPGERYSAIAGRETAVTVAAASLLVAAAGAVIQRRRPM